MALLVLSVIFALENRDPMRIRLFLPEVTAPLWAGLVVALFVGVLIGGLLSRARR